MSVKPMLWEEPSITWDQLPTLQEMIGQLDAFFLAEAIVDLKNRGDCDKGDPKYLDAIGRMMRAITEMKEVELEDEPSGSVMIPRLKYEPARDGRSIDVKYSLVVMERNDFPMIECEIEALQYSGQEIGKASPPNAADDGERADGIGFGNLILMHWEESLPVKVWLGGDWTDEERMRFLAEAVWEMTFFGFSRDKAQRGIDGVWQDVMGSGAQESIDEDDEWAFQRCFQNYGLPRKGMEASRRVVKAACELEDEGLLEALQIASDLHRRLERGTHES